MSPVLKKFIQGWLINTLAVLVATQIVPGIRYDSTTGLLVATLVLGILNAFLRPVLMFLSLPLLIFTLGLFTLVINAVLLYWVGNLVHDFHVDHFSSAFWGALVISLVSLIFNSITGSGNSRVTFRRGKTPPKGNGGGPVIDV